MWVGDNKIGAVGVRISEGVTSHGMALNINTNLVFYDYIVPCGNSDKGVTSMQQVLGHPIVLEQVADNVQSAFSAQFDFTTESKPFPKMDVQSAS